MDNITSNEYNTRTVVTGHLFAWNRVSERPEASPVAVYLHYDSQRMYSPRVTEKGTGSMATFLVATASSIGVPVVQHSELARILFQKASINSSIPIKLFAMVTDVLATAELAKEKENKTSLLH